MRFYYEELAHVIIPQPTICHLQTGDSGEPILQISVPA